MDTSHFSCVNFNSYQLHLQDNWGHHQLHLQDNWGLLKLKIAIDILVNVSLQNK